MESKTINWQKSWFSNTYELLTDGNVVGTLLSKSFSNSAMAEMDKLKITFHTKGVFNQQTEVIDSITSRILGVITYNTWRTRATIMLKDSTIEWKSLNWINSRWGIFSNNKELITCSSNMIKGDITVNEYDALNILIGLYVSEYFNRSFIAIFIVLFIIIFANN